MEVNLVELDSLLGALKGGTSSKSSSFDLLYFSGNRISTFNDEVAVSVDFKSDIEALVPFYEFYDAVRKLVKTENTASLDISGDNMLLKVKRAQLTFNLVQDDSAEDRFSIPNEQLDQAKWHELPDNFADIVSAASACTSNNRSTYMLTCVYINRHDIFGADLIAAYWAEVPENLETMAITSKNIKAILQVNPDKYTCTDSFYHFLNSEYNCVISIRKVNGTYPDYKKFFDVQGAQVSFVPSEAKKALELAAVLAEKDENIKVVTKQAKKDTYMYVQGASAKGVAQAKFPVQITGDVLPVFAAPPAVLKRCFDQTNTFLVSDSVLKCELQDGSYIISLSKE